MLRTLARRSGNSLLSAVVGLAVGLAVGGAAWYYFPRVIDTSTQFTSIADRPEEIPALGRLEPLGGILSVYGPPGDRIVRFEKQADQIGTEVAAGTHLVTMAGDALRNKEVDLAELQLKDAEKQRAAIIEAAAAKKLEVTKELENLERTRTAEVNAQRGKLEVARLQIQQAETQLARLRSLTPGSIPRAELDQQELALRKGQAELKAGEESLAAATQALEDGKQLAEVKRQAAAAEEKRAIQAVPIDALKLGVATAKEKAAIARIQAPVAGTVVRVQTTVGEVTTQVKPILQLAVAGDLVVRAEIPDAEVGRVRRLLAAGVPITARIESRTLKALKLTGKLTKPEQVAQAISRNTVIGLTPGSETDRRVVEAEIAVDTGDTETLKLARSVLGLQVEVSLVLPDPK